MQSDSFIRYLPRETTITVLYIYFEVFFPVLPDDDPLVSKHVAIKILPKYICGTGPYLFADIDVS